jgi:hypothetical protein
MTISIIVFGDMTLSNLINMYEVSKEYSLCLFRPEDGGSAFLLNISTYIRNYTASHPRYQ